MAPEPADLILHLLREIRDEVGSVRKVQDQHSAKFVEISHRMEEIHESHRYLIEAKCGTAGTAE